MFPKIKAHGLAGKLLHTAAAAEMVAMEKNPPLPPFAPEAAKEYGLNIPEENVQNSSANQTRFVAISKALSIPDADKISLCFSLNHTTGSFTAYWAGSPCWD